MNKIVIILLLIFFIVIIFQYKKNNELEYKIKQQEQEIEASSKYIRNLTERLNKKKTEEESVISKAEKLRNLLDSYLAEQKLDENISEEELRENLKKNEQEKRFIPNMIPVKGEFTISQRFHIKHKALDFAAPLGTEVAAAAAGEILSVKEDKYFGNVIVMDHFNGYETTYAHLAKILVESGDFIKKGLTIGLVGDTGNSTAPHLHFEIKLNGKNIDPEKMVILK